MDGLVSDFNPYPLACNRLFWNRNGFCTSYAIRYLCTSLPLTLSSVLLVVIVPRIVPLEYVSTTLGLHKSVCKTFSSIHFPSILKLRSFQLEHTGTTIAQTLSGLWLDSKVKKGKSGSRLLAIFSSDENDSEQRLQYLLNAFLFVNILHLLAIWGLGYLHKIKQSAQKQTADLQSVEEEEEVSGPSAGNAGTSYNPSRSSSVHSPSASPLLHPRDLSSVYPTYGTHPRSRSKSPHNITTTTPTITEVKRGKLFASLSAAIVLFAWVLFFVTSFIKIRSRREREGHL